jgi:hypothetical protein
MPFLSPLRSGSTSMSHRTPKPSRARAQPLGIGLRLFDHPIQSSAGGREDPFSVLVVFADDGGCVWLRFLRRGFRHCFVLLRAGSVWLACEPLKHRIELDVLALPPEFDLAAFYGAQGYRVLQGRRLPSRPRRPFAPAPLTCVTVVKRLLGVYAPWVWTPWQLYAHLTAPELGFCAWSGALRREPDDRRQLDRAGQP